LTGFVRDSGSHAAIVAATVQVGALSTTTGPTGAFTLTQVPTGTQNLLAGANKYQNKSQTISVVLGTNNLGDILLDPQQQAGRGSVKGVARSAGLGVVGGTAAIAGVTAMTGVGGSFTIFNVPPGTYTLTVQSADGLSQATVQQVTVTAGLTTDVGTLELKSGPPGPPF
jgi:hypothetical protein